MMWSVMWPSWRNFLRAFGLNLVIGSVPGIFAAVSYRMTPAVFLVWMVNGWVYSNCVGLPCWLTAPWLVRRMAERPAAVRLAALLGMFALFGVLGCAAANLILWPLGFLGRRSVVDVILSSVQICLLVSLGVGALMFTIESLRARLNSAKEELNRRQIAEERERKIAAEARYASLESRVRPHFLFNTLNSISALVREDPVEAERMIERLASLLRYSLDSELAGLVPLREELFVVKEYLEIERVRFGNRLRFTLASCPEADALMVPPLSVQTLVENAVKYAVGTQREGAEIQVLAGVQFGALRVEVTDNGPGFSAGAGLKPGHGLDLLKRRLDALFGAAGTLEWGTRDGRTLVAISVAS